MKRSTILLFVLLVFVGLFITEINEIAGFAISGLKAEPVSCIDTDDGIDYEKEGTVVYTRIRWGRPRAKIYTDKCSGKNLIFEYFCNDNIVRAKVHKCSMGCQDGACLI